MTVVSDTVPAYRWWNGYVEPQYPVGMWVGFGSITGDASGGQRIITFQFRRPGTRSTLYYNLEQISVSDSAGQANGVDLSTFNMDSLPGPSLGATTMPINYAMLLRQATLLGVLAPETIPKLPVWLGAPGRSVSVSQLSVETPNVNLTTFNVTVQGYYWSQRSLGRPGGPQRPPTTMYGQ